MEEFALQAFIYEIQHQCKFADLAFQDIVSALRESTAGESTADRVFLAAHTFLVAVGNISKLLWPTKRSCAARGHELRELLQVGDGSVLKSRAFRNHFEHFDERLDKWANSSKHKNFADSNIGPPEFISGLDPEDWMRNLDPTSLTLTFHGDSYHILEIMEALKPICAASQRKTQGLSCTG